MGTLKLAPKEISMKNRRTTLRWLPAIALLALVPLASQAQTQAEKPFLGSWKGNLSIAGQNLEIRLLFSLDEAKKIKGTFDSITQGATGLKLGDIKIEGKAISCVISDLAAQGQPTFKGKLDAAGGKIEGEFTQLGFTGTFSIEKEKPQK
jgi:hypothetical protein